MSSIKVSCIIVNNTKDNLLLVLQSVLNQTHKNLECIVINQFPCVEQEVTDILKNELFILVEQGLEDENLAASKVFNTCSGSFIIILNNNRFFYDRDVIKNLLLDVSEIDDIVYGDMVEVYPDGKVINKLYPSNISFENILYGYLDLFPVALINKRLFDRFGLYYEEFPLTNRMFFLLKACVFNVLNITHKNTLVVYQKVNRSGGLNKYSNDHLLSKERDKLIQNMFSDSMRNFLYEKIELAKYFNTARIMIFVKILEKIKNSLLKFAIPLVRKAKYSFHSFTSNIQLGLYKKKYGANIYNIPIIINNRNHLKYLMRLINSLEIRGYKNIYIIDNNSKYPPLKEYYSTIPYKVFALEDNIGFCALWDTNIYDKFKDDYYVYTDSDLELVDECPNDFLVVMQFLLNKYKVGKVGLSLLTDDLPSYFGNKNEVIEWESQFQKNVIEQLACNAQVDTTFALYGPGRFGHAGMLTSLRSKFPYSARHLPWYENTEQLDLEQKYYYMNAKTSSHWSAKIQLQDSTIVKKD